MKYDWDSVPDIGPSLTVAHQILWLRRDTTTTPMQIIKLVYICHGCTLGWTDEPLLEESVEAWRYGPVVPSVYHSFKAFGDQPITLTTAEQAELTSQQKKLIATFERPHRELDGLQLSAMTHARGTPWDRTIKSRGEGAVIPNALIKNYYHRMLTGKLRLRGR